MRGLVAQRDNHVEGALTVVEGHSASSGGTHDDTRDKMLSNGMGVDLSHGVQVGKAPLRCFVGLSPKHEATSSLAGSLQTEV